jgi:uncharacterized protein
MTPGEKRFETAAGRSSPAVFIYAWFGGNGTLPEDTFRTVRVKVTPGSSKPRVEEQSDGTFRVYVSASPDKGKANSEMLRSVAKYLGVPRSAIAIIRGRTAREKLLRIDAH